MPKAYGKAALLAVDIQNDFCPPYTGTDGSKRPGGALAVAGGGEIIAPINRMAEMIRRGGGQALATQDWHPAGHISFAATHRGKKPGDLIIIPVPDEPIERFAKEFPGLTDPIPGAVQQILWPVHCLQNSPGAAFHDELDRSLIDFVFRKGWRKNIDSYSAFFENDRCTPTDLHGYLGEKGIETLYIAGLALDYCVFYSVVDALRLGYKTFCVAGASRGIDIPAGSLKNALAVMKDRGAEFAEATDI
ncbi:MAG: nicotinamidase [Treponema sp.]|jgi:nicotinamidase/pyrazinamidase|nr:nicotinamidase [Treponema sp.]